MTWCHLPSHLVTIRPEFSSTETRLYFKLLPGEQPRKLSEQSCHHYVLFYEECISTATIASPLLEIRVVYSLILEIDSLKP